MLEAKRAVSLATLLLRLAVVAATHALRRRRGRGSAPEVFGASLRRGLESLGLTYLKLGQFLAIRHDLLPEPVTGELERLFEKAPPIRYEEALGVIEEQFGRTVKVLFRTFEDEPLASASVAQVHAAVTHAGERVAVKVQRPGIRRIFAADMRNMRRLAGVLDAVGCLGTFSLSETVEQFERYTARELDFVTEGKTADRLREKASRGMVVPRVHWDLSGERVLTLDRIDGVSLVRVIETMSRGGERSIRAEMPAFDRVQALDNLTTAALHQLFAVGFFHGDPHPGNVFVLADNSVAFLDFGIFGELNDHERIRFRDYTYALAAGDAIDAFRHLSEIYSAGAESDPVAFRRETVEMLRRWYAANRDSSASSRERHIGNAFDAMVGIVRRHGYRSQMKYLLFWRALIVLDSIALRVDPGYDLATKLRSFFISQVDLPVEIHKAVKEGVRDALACRSALRERSLEAGSGEGILRIFEAYTARGRRSSTSRGVAAAILCVALSAVWGGGTALAVVTATVLFMAAQAARKAAA